MQKINTGILTNVSPLNEEQVKDIERRLFTKGDTIAYLDENYKLCFVSTRDNPSGIRDLAWNTAYMLHHNGLDKVYYKSTYKRTGLESFEHADTGTKLSVEDPWMYLDELYKYNGRILTTPFYSSSVDSPTLYDNIDGTYTYVKVSDSIFTPSSFTGAEVCIKSSNKPDRVFTITGNDFSMKLTTGTYYDIYSQNVFGSKIPLIKIIHNPDVLPGCPAGTYFLSISGTDVDSGEAETTYVESFSCLTNREVLDPYNQTKS